MSAMSAKRIPMSSELRPWLYRIASNSAISSLRRDKHRLLMRGVSSVASAPDIAELDHVRIALRAIPPHQAVAIILTLHEGFSRREAAEILSVNGETLKTRLARGRLNFAAAYSRIERGLKG